MSDRSKNTAIRILLVMLGASMAGAGAWFDKSWLVAFGIVILICVRHARRFGAKA